MPRFLIGLDLSTVPVSRPFGVAVRDERSPVRGASGAVLRAARAADVAGFDGVVLRQHDDGLDPLVVATAVARGSRRLSVVPEVDPSSGSPVYLAKMGSTMQRSTGDGIGWLLDEDNRRTNRAAWGDHDDQRERIGRIAELVTVARGVWGGRGFTHEGERFTVRNGGFEEPLSRPPFPFVRIAGDTDALLDVSARHADIHVWPYVAPVDLRSRMADLDARAARAGRRVQHAVALSIVARSTAVEASEVEGLAAIRGSFANVVDSLRSYEAVGVHEFVASLPRGDGEIYRFGRHVVSAFDAALTGR